MVNYKKANRLMQTKKEVEKVRKHSRIGGGMVGIRVGPTEVP